MQVRDIFKLPIGGNFFGVVQSVSHDRFTIEWYFSHRVSRTITYRSKDVLRLIVPTEEERHEFERFLMMRATVS